MSFQSHQPSIQQGNVYRLEPSKPRKQHTCILYLVFSTAPTYSGVSSHLFNHASALGHFFPSVPNPLAKMTATTQSPTRNSDTLSASPFSIQARWFQNWSV